MFQNAGVLFKHNSGIRFGAIIKYITTSYERRKALWLPHLTAETAGLNSYAAVLFMGNPVLPRCHSVSLFELPVEKTNIFVSYIHRNFIRRQFRLYQIDDCFLKPFPH